MFGIGGFELFIILVFGFLIFGPDKLPDIAKTVGKGIARFREAQQEVNEAIGDEKLIDFDNPDQPIKDPMETLDRIAQRHEEKKAAKEAESSNDAGEAKESATEAEPKQESFTERKARYERERAARKAAEAEAAKKDAEAPAEGKPAEEVVAEAPAEAPAAEASAEPAADEAVADAAVPAEAPAEGGDA